CRFEQRRCLSRFECVGGAANDQIVAAAAPCGFAPDLPGRDVILRKDQQHEPPNIGRNRRARPEWRQRLPVYVSHIFALTLHRRSVPIRAPIIVYSPTTLNRWNSAPPSRLPGRPGNEDRRRAVVQDPVIVKDERSVSARKPSKAP